MKITTILSAITVASLSQVVSTNNCCKEMTYSDFNNEIIEPCNSLNNLTESKISSNLRQKETRIEDLQAEHSEYNTNGWHGWWRIYYYNKVKVLDYKKYSGVYLRLTPYFSKAGLISGSDSYKSSVKYNKGYSYKNAAYYNCQIDSNVEESLSTGFGYLDNAFSMEGDLVIKNSISSKCKEECKYVRQGSTDETAKIDIVLNKDVIDEFDRNYPNVLEDNANIAKGLFGEFYIAKISYRRCSNICGNEQYDEADDHYATIVICDESSMARGFICTYGSDSSTVYYLG